METLGNSARVEGFRVSLDEEGKEIWLLDTGKKFNGIVSETADIDPSGLLLGSDIREGDSITALREDVPPELLASNAKSQVMAQIDGAKLSITQRRDNVANPFVRFDVVKVL